eukprot:c24346_g1_i1 orf=289-5058(-)
MHGQHHEDTKQKRHMWSEPSHIPTGSEVDSARLKCFTKDGRKIAIGDTALFQAGNALPFIGIIRKANAEKEGSLKLRVNWLYRPGDIELGKGASLEAAPNEVFYSFHKDEISAASLLHPCKVAFLPKGVELPSRVSSFVCRRVYDTSNKCLYWLTDQDYTDEHQGEVDRLLNKTKHDMQATAQSERPSQRALSERTSSKPDAVNVALLSQGKNKKRERTDQTSDSSKRERHMKVEDAESKREGAMRFEDFAAIADKEGGLTSIPHVDQLVQVMAQERNDTSKKLADVVSHRTLLAGIIAATEREDCLTHFVRLGGLPVLDDWLQEAYKGKLGDGNSKEGDKGLEELLLILLRALEKLPVDLDALKTCHVGKSVNLFKNHKNSEVQKKARKLVYTWKKRVNAEMNSLDEAKSGLYSATTWSSRPSVDTLTSKGCFAGGSKSTASTQLAVNGSGPSGETTSVSGCKDLPETAFSKDNSAKLYASGASQAVAVVKEEKSCSSSQSQNNSQSWCSGAGKGAGSWKEEGKAPSVVSVGNKTIGTALRSHTKSHPTATSTGFQRESTGRHKTSGLEKMSSAGSSDKKAGEVARAENHNSPRLIVRLPNPGRSPAHSTSGGCLIDGGASNNRGSSPSMMDRHDSLNASSRAPDIHSPDTSGDTKCGNSVAKCGKFEVDCKEEINRSCIATVDDVDYKSSDAKHRPNNLLTSKCPPATVKKGTNSSVITTTPGSSNTNPAGPSIDMVEGGIDLLASVATCEGSEAEKSFSESTGGEGHPPITEGNRDSAAQGRVLIGPEGNNQGSEDGEKQRKDVGAKCELEEAATRVRESDLVADDSKEVPSTLTGEIQQEEIAIDGAAKLVIVDGTSGKETPPIIAEATVVSQDAHVTRDANVLQYESSCRLSAGVSNSDSLTDECQVSTPRGLDNVLSLQEGSENGSKALSSLSALTRVPLTCAKAGDLVPGFYEEDALEVARQVAMEVEQEVQRYGHPETQEASSISPGQKASIYDKGVDETSKCNKASSGNADDGIMKDVGGADAAPADASVGTVTEGRKETNLDGFPPARGEEVDESFSCLKDDTKLRPVLEPTVDSPAAVEVYKVEDHSSSRVSEIMPMAPLAEASVPDKEVLLPKDRSKDVVERPIFDLNEGFLTDEGLHDRTTQASVSGSSPAALVPDRTSGFPAQSSSLAVPVAVVSATKGVFIPPSNISRPKGELGWKGSAATSAFRPAEPRRMAETLQSSLDTTATTATMAATDQNGKQARFLDIDLNVADDRMMEDAVVASANEADIASNGPAASRPELDLNRVDDSDESTVLPESNSRSPLTATRAMLDFDLNDGLGCEETGVDEVSSHNKNLERTGVPVFGETKSTPELVNVVPWYNTSTSSVPATVVMPAFSANRQDLPYPVVAAPSAKSVITTSHNFNQFGGNSYQGGALMSSASVPYTTTQPAAFSHAGFPFGAGFPSASTSYNISSASNAALTNALPFPISTSSQLGSAGAVVSPFGRPYLGGCNGETSGADPSVSWARPSLDLNAGPDVIGDAESKDEGCGMRASGGLGQLSYQQVGTLSGPLKRKEPEAGSDPFRANFKQMAWREL